MNLTVFSPALMNFGFVYIIIFLAVELPFPCKNVFCVGVGRRSACVTHRSLIYFKDVCKSDIRAMAMDIEKWKDVANDHSRMKRDLHRGFGVRREETAAYHLREASSKEQKQHSDPGGKVSSH